MAVGVRSIIKAVRSKPQCYSMCTISTTFVPKRKETIEVGCISMPGSYTPWQVPHMSPFGASIVLWTRVRKRRRSRSYPGMPMCLQPSDFSNGIKKPYGSSGIKLR